MKKLALVFAVGAAALIGGSAANATDNTVKAKAATDVAQQSTDISARKRHYRHRHHVYRHGYRHYGYRHYRPYYGGSYAYAPRPYYGRGYGYGGPGISFSFGGGRW
ncbi:MAG: hypothetical protein Q8M18_00285 [Bradyrhizobium sp.]|nr:hypothetical protein [Bradyrhizobium sp.]